MPLNATVVSDLELHTTRTKKGQASGSGGSGIVPIIYIRKKINDDFLNNYLYLCLYQANFTTRNYLYLAIRQTFYYPELSVSGYLVNFTIRESLAYSIIAISGNICQRKTFIYYPLK